MKIYLDTCCYGRPFDDKTQRAIEDEADAVMTAIDVCQIIGHVIVGSMVVTHELGKIRDANKRADVETFFKNTIDNFFVVSNSEHTRAAALHTQGLGAMDALHLAAAEAAGVDILLTTDKDFLKIAAQIKTPVKVMNPLNFLPEAIK